MDWMNEDDPDDEIIKCLKCNTPIKAAAHVLSGMGLKQFYKLVERNDKKIKKNGHFVYPVVGKVQMYQLFVDFDRNNEDLADERIQKP
ncbi:unnamed protein product [Macrosiphum euphorbiae]|nr:unnamed protein product [Macrosiphum euphorbiae]